MLKIGLNSRPQATQHARPGSPPEGPGKTEEEDSGSKGPGDRADISEAIKEAMSRLQERKPMQNLFSGLQSNFAQ
ncbi:MAG: hypothetical protein KF760_11190 [Candidatus Eremiobacteraeota bacterium]|nr:hypothetical protein [Candidatus Eremiobacteraeota bacterium]MCW5870634.1 hypothetical protein [Candidatus Eremiobacteraeota bacterium]